MRGCAGCWSGSGACLAVMNSAFYLALDRLPMSTVAAMEFVGTIGVALYGLRTARNFGALALAVIGVFLLLRVTWAIEPAGVFWALLNAALFVGYIVIGHAISQSGASAGVERLGAAMALAFIFVMPIGFLQAVRRCHRPCWCSPVWASASARRWCPMSAISLRCRGCRARASR
jgi:inner membrane transporter RhtA